MEKRRISKRLSRVIALLLCLAMTVQIIVANASSVTVTNESLGSTDIALLFRANPNKTDDRANADDTQTIQKYNTAVEGSGNANLTLYAQVGSGVMVLQGTRVYLNLSRALENGEALRINSPIRNGVSYLGTAYTNADKTYNNGYYEYLGIMQYGVSTINGEEAVYDICDLTFTGLQKDIDVSLKVVGPMSYLPIDATSMIDSTPANNMQTSYVGHVKVMTGAVNFYNDDKTTLLKSVNAAVGDKVAQADFPTNVKSTQPNKDGFLGWFTEDGKRFTADSVIEDEEGLNVYASFKDEVVNPVTPPSTKPDDENKSSLGADNFTVAPNANLTPAQAVEDAKVQGVDKDGNPIPAGSITPDSAQLAAINDSKGGETLPLKFTTPDGQSVTVDVTITGTASKVTFQDMNGATLAGSPITVTTGTKVPKTSFPTPPAVAGKEFVRWGVVTPSANAGKIFTEDTVVDQDYVVKAIYNDNVVNPVTPPETKPDDPTKAQISGDDFDYDPTGDPLTGPQAVKDAGVTAVDKDGNPISPSDITADPDQLDAINKAPVGEKLPLTFTTPDGQKLTVDVTVKTDNTVKVTFYNDNKTTVLGTKDVAKGKTLAQSDFPTGMKSTVDAAKKFASWKDASGKMFTVDTVVNADTSVYATYGDEVTNPVTPPSTKPDDPSKAQISANNFDKADPASPLTPAQAVSGAGVEAVDKDGNKIPSTSITPDPTQLAAINASKGNETLPLTFRTPDNQSVTVDCKVGGTTSTVTFQDINGTTISGSTKTVTTGSKLAQSDFPTPPAVTGKTFTRWQVVTPTAEAGKLFSTDTVISTNYVVKAIYNDEVTNPVTPPETKPEDPAKSQVGANDFTFAPTAAEPNLTPEKAKELSGVNAVDPTGKPISPANITPDPAQLAAINAAEPSTTQKHPLKFTTPDGQSVTVQVTKSPEGSIPVTFVDNSGATIKTVYAVGGKVPATSFPTAPTVAGKTFASWKITTPASKAGNMFTKDTTVTEPTTVQAVYADEVVNPVHPDPTDPDVTEPTKPEDPTKSQISGNDFPYDPAKDGDPLTPEKAKELADIQAVDPDGNKVPLDKVTVDPDQLDAINNGKPGEKLPLTFTTPDQQKITVEVTLDDTGDNVLTVTFNSYNDAKLSAVKVFKGKTVAAKDFPKPATVSGKQFVAWQTVTPAANAGDRFTDETVVNEDMTVKATYKDEVTNPVNPDPADPDITDPTKPEDPDKSQIGADNFTYDPATDGDPLTPDKAKELAGVEATDPQGNKVPLKDITPDPKQLDAINNAAPGTKDLPLTFTTPDGQKVTVTVDMAGVGESENALTVTFQDINGKQLKQVQVYVNHTVPAASFPDVPTVSGKTFAGWKISDVKARANTVGDLFTDKTEVTANLTVKAYYGNEVVNPVDPTVDPTDPTTDPTDKEDPTKSQLQGDNFDVNKADYPNGLTPDDAKKLANVSGVDKDNKALPLNKITADPEQLKAINDGAPGKYPLTFTAPDGQKVEVEVTTTDTDPTNNLKVKFTDINGKEIKTVDAYRGQTVPSASFPAAPAVTDKTFVGWKTTDGKEFNTTTVVNTNLTVQAHYKDEVVNPPDPENPDPNEKPDPDKATVGANDFGYDKVDGPLTPEKAKDLAGVEAVDKDGNPIPLDKVKVDPDQLAAINSGKPGTYPLTFETEDGQKVPVKVTLTDSSTDNNLTVTFQEASGKQIKVVKVYKGEKVPASEVPTPAAVAGKDFFGWIDVNDGAAFTTDKAVTKNMVVKATYKDGTGTGDDGSKIGADDFDYDKADGPLTPEKAKDLADVVAVDKDGNKIPLDDVKVDPDQLADINSGKPGKYPLTFETPGGAKVEVEVNVTDSDPANNFTVVFQDKDGKTIKSVPVYKGETIPAKDFPTVPSVDKKEFTGWYAQDGSLFTSQTKVDKNLTVKATYKDKVINVPDPTDPTDPTVKPDEDKSSIGGNDFPYDKADGPLTPEKVKDLADIVAVDKDGNPIPLDKVTVDPDELAAINDGQPGKYPLTITTPDGQEIKVTVDLTDSNPANNLTVKFVDANNAELKTVNVYRGNTIPAKDFPAVPEIKDKTFTGWKTTAGAEFTSKTPVTSNLTVKATYKDEGTNVPDPTDPTDPTTKPDEDKATIAANNFAYDKADGDLTADKARDLAGVEATDKDGNKIDPSKITPDATQLAAINSGKPGKYPLSFTTPDGQKVQVVVTTTDSSTDNNLTVTFQDANGKELKVVKVYKGEMIKASDVPSVETIKDKEFMGWYAADGTRFEISKPVTKNLVVKATYKDNAVNPVDPTDPSDPTTPEDKDKSSIGGDDFNYDKADGILTPEKAQELAGIVATDKDGKPINPSKVTVNPDELAAINDGKPGKYPLTFTTPDGQELKVNVELTDSDPTNNLTVKFVDVNGKELKSVPVYRGQTIAVKDMPTAPSITDKIFDGWFSTDDNSRFTSDTKVTKDLTVKATYSDNAINQPGQNPDQDKHPDKPADEDKSSIGGNNFPYDKADGELTPEKVIDLGNIVATDKDGKPIDPSKITIDPDELADINKGEPGKYPITITTPDGQKIQVTVDMTDSTADNWLIVKFIDHNEKTLKEVKVYTGKTVAKGDFPTAAELDGKTFTGWKVTAVKGRAAVVGELFTPSTVVTMDTTVKAFYGDKVVNPVDPDTNDKEDPKAAQLQADNFKYDKAQGTLTPEEAKKLANVSGVGADNKAIPLDKITVDDKQLAAINSGVPGSYDLTFTEPSGQKVTVKVTTTDTDSYNNLKVTFQDQNGKELKVVNVYRGQTVAAKDFPEKPVVSGKDFVGWITADGALFTVDTKVTKDVIAKATYKDNGTNTVPDTDKEDTKPEDPNKSTIAGNDFDYNKADGVLTPDKAQELAGIVATDKDGNKIPVTGVTVDQGQLDKINSGEPGKYPLTFTTPDGVKLEVTVNTKDDANLFTVTFKGNNGSTLKTVQVYKNGTVAKGDFPTVPSVSGKEFASWKTSDGKLFTEDTKVSGNITVNATYFDKVTNPVPDDGTSTKPENPDKSQVGADGFDYDKADGPLTADDVKDKANVEAVDKDGNKIPMDQIKVDQDQLDAINKGEPGKYPITIETPDGEKITVDVVVTDSSKDAYFKVTFQDKDGKELKTVQVYNGKTVPKNSFPSAPTIAGKTFASWKTTDGNQFTENTKVTKNLTVKATYGDEVANKVTPPNTEKDDPNKSQISGSGFDYDVTEGPLSAETAKDLAGIEAIDKDGNKIPLENVKVDEAQLGKLNDAIKNNTTGTYPLTFTTPDGEKIQVSVNISDAKADKVTVTFVNKDGATIKDFKVTKGAKVPKESFPTAPTVAGKTFVGWKLGDGTLFTENTVVSKSVTVKATYADKVTNPVVQPNTTPTDPTKSQISGNQFTYDTADGPLSADTAKDLAGIQAVDKDGNKIPMDQIKVDSAQLNALNSGKPGTYPLTFTTPDGQTLVVTVTTEDSSGKNNTGSHTVTFLDKDGNKLSSITVNNGESIATSKFPTAPSVTGMSFFGWKAQDGTFVTNGTKITADTTVTATYKDRVVVGTNGEAIGANNVTYDISGGQLTANKITELAGAEAIDKNGNKISVTPDATQLAAINAAIAAGKTGAYKLTFRTAAGTEIETTVTLTNNSGNNGNNGNNNGNNGNNNGNGNGNGNGTGNGTGNGGNNVNIGIGIGVGGTGTGTTGDNSNANNNGNGNNVNIGIGIGVDGNGSGSTSNSNSNNNSNSNSNNTSTNNTTGSTTTTGTTTTGTTTTPGKGNSVTPQTGDASQMVPGIIGLIAIAAIAGAMIVMKGKRREDEEDIVNMLK